MKSFYRLVIHLTLYSFVSCNNFWLDHNRAGYLGSPPCDFCTNLPPEEWFEQYLDHFTSADTRKWQQRYFVNKSFYKYPGPVFLMIGGEGPADPKWMVKGAWIEYAKQFNALCILIEHRYYGKSRPTEDLSVKNLKYLSSEQALEDLVYFISEMKNKMTDLKESKWIAFGGSYPGSLAAWLRYKYPHLVDGSISSSGPLKAQLDFKEYFSVVVNAINEKTSDNKCVLQIKKAIRSLKSLMRMNPETVEKDFRVCTSFKNASFNDLRNFYNSIAGNFADLVQYNEDNRIGANEKYRNVTINSICKIFNSEGQVSAYKNMAFFNSLMLAEFNKTCLDYSYQNQINALRNSNWSMDSERQWMYQCCTEFGFFQTSSATTEVFGNDFPLDFYIQQCEDVFGRKFNESFISSCIERTNEHYGALNILASDVVFVHGSVDPWHALGIIKTEENNSPAIYIKGTAHCANMYPSKEDDPPELKMARVEIAQYISSWLDKPNNVIH